MTDPLTRARELLAAQAATIEAEADPGNVGPVLADLCTELDSLTERITTIADENGGPHPVQSADESLSCIERQFTSWYRDWHETQMAREKAEARITALENGITAEARRVVALEDELRGEIARDAAAMQAISAAYEPVHAYLNKYSVGHGGEDIFRLIAEDAERLRSEVERLCSANIIAAADLVRLSGPDNLPTKWGELVDRESVVVVALRIKKAADAARRALGGE